MFIVHNRYYVKILLLSLLRQTINYLVMVLHYVVHSVDVMGVRLDRYYESDEIEFALKKGIITPRLCCPLIIWGNPNTILEFHYVAL